MAETLKVGAILTNERYGTSARFSGASHFFRVPNRYKSQDSKTTCFPYHAKRQRGCQEAYARTSVKEAKPKEVCQAAQAGNPNRNPQTETPNRNPQPNTIRNWGSPLGRNGWFKVARRDADFVVLSF